MSEHYEQPEEHKVSELPESFFIDIGSASDFFDKDAKETFLHYSENPGDFNEIQEILILDRLRLALAFEQPGVADQDGVYKLADMIRGIARDKDFSFNSELAYRYAKFLEMTDATSYFAIDEYGYKYTFKYDYDFGKFDFSPVEWRSPPEQSSDNSSLKNPEIEAFRKLFREGTSFRSFLSYLIETGQVNLENELPNELFIRWMLHESPDSFHKNLTTIRNFKGDKDKLLSAFLATEFGDDFGDRIIEIAEHAQPNEAEKIFEIINAFREESAFFAKMYEPFDTELARATEKAMNERLADLIVVAEHVARDGAMTVDVSPGRDAPDYVYDRSYDIRIESIDHVINTMQQLLDTLVRRREIVEATSTKVSRVVANSEELGYQIYRFHNEDLGDALLHIRPEGAGDYDKAFEYGNYDGVEASISWVVNPAGDYRLASDKDPDGVSIRFDREGRRVDEAPDSPERSSIREDGSISLDLSSGVGKKRAAPVQIGRIIAAGNILRAEEEGTAVSLHHNTNFFDQAKYGSATGFKELANYMSIMAEALIQSQRSKKAGKKVVAVAGA